MTSPTNASNPTVISRRFPSLLSPLGLCCLLPLGLVALPMGSARADIVPIINAGFEDTSGQNPFNEFTFGVPNGWSLYDPDFVSGPGVFTGTLEPNGVDFFNTTAPEGSLVTILFNSVREGEGEYGLVQTLGTVLEANTQYSLSVQVGNIGSGIASDGTFFNLDEFPGYRVELLAGGVVIAADNNSLTIPEAEFELSTVEFTTGLAHAQLGQSLGIRLVNENVIPAGFSQATSPDLEVDFDDVRLSSSAIPEPQAWLWVGVGVATFFSSRRRRPYLAERLPGIVPSNS